MSGPAPGVDGDTEHVLVDGEQVHFKQERAGGAEVPIEQGHKHAYVELDPVHGNPSIEGVGNDPDDLDVDGEAPPGLGPPEVLAAFSHHLGSALPEPGRAWTKVQQKHLSLEAWIEAC